MASWRARRSCPYEVASVCYSLRGLIKVYSSCRSCRNPFASISAVVVAPVVGKARSGLSIIRGAAGLGRRFCERRVRPRRSRSRCLNGELAQIDGNSYLSERHSRSMKTLSRHRAPAVHRDPDAGLPQAPGEGEAGELAALVGLLKIPACRGPAPRRARLCRSPHPGCSTDAKPAHLGWPMSNRRQVKKAAAPGCR